MKRIAGIRFRGGGKIYYFDAGEYELPVMEKVLVETERGLSIGTIAIAPRQMEDMPECAHLKPILRIASEEDQEKVAQNRERNRGKGVLPQMHRETRPGYAPRGSGAPL